MEQSSLVYIVAPFMGWVVAQLIKIAIKSNKSIDWRVALQSGGMPSSHAAFMAALSVAVGVGEGFSSVAFAITLAISAIVVYDATDVRLTTGQQTNAIKQLAKKEGLKINDIHNAKGHTIPEVIVGMAVGLVVGLLAANLV